MGVGREDDALIRVGSLSFLAVALGFWPFWVPFSILCLECRRRVRLCLGVAALAGLAFGSILYFPLALNAEEWLATGVRYHSIRYNLKGLPAFEIAPHEWWDLGYTVLACRLETAL